MVKAKQGINCRLFGRDFVSVAQAARYWRLSYHYAHEMVTAGRHRDTDRDSIRKRWAVGTHGYRGDE